MPLDHISIQKGPSQLSRAAALGEHAHSGDRAAPHLPQQQPQLVEPWSSRAEHGQHNPAGPKPGTAPPMAETQLRGLGSSIRDTTFVWVAPACFAKATRTKQLPFPKPGLAFAIAHRGSTFQAPLITVTVVGITEGAQIHAKQVRRQRSHLHLTSHHCPPPSHQPFGHRPQPKQGTMVCRMETHQRQGKVSLQPHWVLMPVSSLGQEPPFLQAPLEQRCPSEPSPIRGSSCCSSTSKNLCLCAGGGSKPRRCELPLGDPATASTAPRASSSPPKFGKLKKNK